MVTCEREHRQRRNSREAIIAAARNVFSAKGFNGATVEEITSRAKLSPGSLYRYFKNKEELYTCLSINILKQFATENQKIMKSKLSVEEKMERYCDVFIKAYEHDPMILINLFHLQSGDILQYLSDETMQELKKYSALAYGSIVTTIKEGIDAGVFTREYPVALVDILWGVYNGVVLWVNSKWLLDDQKDFVKSTLETAFEIILKGMKAQ